MDEPSVTTAATVLRAQEKRDVFLAALAETGNVTRSARRVGIVPSTAYGWREVDSDFASAWESALRDAVDALEGEAYRRAYEGVARPVYMSGGKDVGPVVAGYVQEYSDTLMCLLLKAHHPERFRERTDARISGLLDLTPDDADALKASIAARTARLVAMGVAL